MVQGRSFCWRSLYNPLHMFWHYWMIDLPRSIWIVVQGIHTRCHCPIQQWWYAETLINSLKYMLENVKDFIINYLISELLTWATIAFDWCWSRPRLNKSRDNLTCVCAKACLILYQTKWDPMVAQWSFSSTY